MEGDYRKTKNRGFDDYFNPLPPHGGRLSQWQYTSLFRAISIHSLRMEGDIAKYF